MRDINSIKQSLIESDIYIQNNYFDLYLNLINDNLKRLPEKYKTQKHHILPRHYFNHYNLEIDESKDNIVNLIISDHIKAHYYLYNCCKNNDEKLSNLYCLRRMLDGRYSNLKSITDINENECIKLYEEIQKYNSQIHKGKRRPLSEETKSKIGKANKYKYNDLKTMNKDNKEIRVKPEEVDYYLDQGYKIGRSEKTLKSLSENYNYESKGMLGKRQSDYQKQRAKETMEGKPKSDAAKKAMSESKKGTKKYIDPKTGKMQYIKIEDIPYYESLGFYKYKRIR